MTLPIAVILFWEESWYGLVTGPLKPKWFGVIGYWIYFTVGWCLFRQPQLFDHFNRRWGWKLVVGSVLALGLNYYCNSLLQEGRFSWFYPMINQTEVRDYAALRQQLLMVSEQETSSVTRRVWENLGPDYQDFVLRKRDVAGDQLAGLVMKINMSSVTDSDRCLSLRKSTRVSWHSVRGATFAK